MLRLFAPNSPVFLRRNGHIDEEGVPEGRGHRRGVLE
jgi:hypothetical protein